jgi:hypothetical protein
MGLVGTWLMEDGGRAGDEVETEDDLQIVV